MFIPHNVSDHVSNACACDLVSGFVVGAAHIPDAVSLKPWDITYFFAVYNGTLFQTCSVLHKGKHFIAAGIFQIHRTACCGKMTEVQSPFHIVVAGISNGFDVTGNASEISGRMNSRSCKVGQYYMAVLNDDFPQVLMINGSAAASGHSISASDFNIAAVLDGDGMSGSGTVQTVSALAAAAVGDQELPCTVYGDGTGCADAASLTVDF